MNPNFYLFLPCRNISVHELESTELSWVYKNVNNELRLSHGLLNAAALAAVNYSITIVLPGEDVLFLTAEIPGKNSQIAQQAVPYVLEDSVIDDVDELHFAINKSIISKVNDNALDNRYDVAVINKQYFKSILEKLNNVGIQADAMTTDYLLLARKNMLFVYGERVLFSGVKLKFATSIDSYIEGAINLNEDLTDDETIKLIYCENESEEKNKLDKLTANNKFEIERCTIHPLLYLIENHSSIKTVNLLQGSYKKKKNWSKTGKTWIPVAALFLVWLSIQSILFVIDYINLSKQNDTLNTEITRIYKNTFPQSLRIIDAKAQMQQKLKELKKRKGQSGRSFTEMLSGSASIFSKSKDLKIKSLRYYDGRINIELQVASLQALDKLKDELNKEKGYQVEIQNASSGKETVTARIQIIGAE